MFFRFAVILAFDVKVERDAQLYADNEGVRIFQADIIYHLQDAFLKYRSVVHFFSRLSPLLYYLSYPDSFVEISIYGLSLVYKFSPQFR